MVSSTSIDTIAANAKGWLDQCLSTHTSCQKRARLSTIWSSDNMHVITDLGVGDMMPRRLLKIEAGNASHRTRLSIQEFDKSDPESPYIALSYCWGGGKTIPRSTRDNISARKMNGIAKMDLPATFRDAIEITTRIGYKYLWIDALCIVQDDQEDWKAEAPRMAVIYGNAACTIHVMDVPDASHGFKDIDPKLARGGALEHRAWTMQERAITPRSLLFTNKGLKWECREGTALFNHDMHMHRVSMESIPHEPRPSLKALFTFFRDWRIPGTTGPDREPYDEPRIDLDYGVKGDKLEYYSFLQTWWRLVTEYSPRHLTKESDRFLAMNGVAAVAQQWAQMRSTWALWLEFLETELLWYVDPAGPDGVKTNKWLAPCWSWAAIKHGRVRNAFYERVRTKDDYENMTLLLTPQIRVSNGTSFDQSLPIPAWTSRDSHSIELKGDLREGHVEAFLDEHKTKRYRATFQPVGRWSEDERFDFRPDVASQFPVGKKVRVICMLFWHMDAERCGLQEHTNLLLVLRQRRDQELVLYDDGVPERDTQEERTMLRVGYMECRFKEKRKWEEIYEDMWNKHIWLL